MTEENYRSVPHAGTYYDYPGQPIRKSAGHDKQFGIIRSKSTSLRMQFWTLCGVVLLMIVIYGAVYWDTLTSSTRIKFRAAPKVEWDRSHNHFDLHLEDHIFGHVREADDTFLSVGDDKGEARRNTVAIGCAVTSRGYQNLTLDNIQFRLPLLRTLLPSFCHTASAGYQYHFYISFDVDDPSLQRSDYLEAIYNHFEQVRNSLCAKSINVSLHFVQCSHSHNPAWAQNDAMMEAYLDNMEYYYRVNDDTIMLSPAWTQGYIEALQGFDPPYVGVVGPVHRGGNEFILTYDFVHKTHIDIFGYYYPRLFTDWWADDWITAVYGVERTIKLPGIKLKHTQESGQRYRVQYDNGELVHYQVAHDRKILNRYIKATELWKTQANNETASNKKVISMSLWGADPRYTFGALRNVQLTPVFFPGWVMRVYVEENNRDRFMRYDPTPKRIIKKLSNLGAEIVYVNTDEINIPPMMWRFLPADDMTLDCFIVRDADARVNDRDAAIVKDWLKSKSPFHCVRDHPSHSSYSLSGGLWGARPKQLYSLIPVLWKNLMMGSRTGYMRDMVFLQNLVWRKVESVAYCHDSFSCKSWPGSHPFPVKRHGTEHVGQVFDAFGYARDEDMKIIRETAVVSECLLVNASRTETNADYDEFAGEIHSGHLKKLEESMEKQNMHQNMEKVLKESDNDQDPEPVMLEHTQTSNKSDINSFTVLGFPKQQNEVNTDLGINNALYNTENINKTFLVWNMNFNTAQIQDIKHLLSSRNDVTIIEKSWNTICDETCTLTRNTTNNDAAIHFMRQTFLKNYQNDPIMNEITHFLCSSPLSLCELYVKFNKPIVMYLTTRYDQDSSGLTSHQEWTNTIKKITDSHRNIVIAADLYHSNYFRYYINEEPLLISPVCSYVNTSYNPTKSSILLSLVHSSSFLQLFMGYFRRLIRDSKTSLQLQYIPNLYPDTSYSHIASHSAIIHIPQWTSTYNVCEHYQMAIPIFAPSLNLAANWYQKYKLFDFRTWNDTHKRTDNNMSDPNDLKTAQEIKKWLQYLDIYQKPHILYFDSVRDLVSQLTSPIHFNDISQQMQKYNEHNEMMSEHKWSSIFH